MFKKLVRWHKALEDDILAMLVDPALAAQVPSGYRRHFASQVVQMSAIERQQLLAFSLKYRGARCYGLIGMLAVVLALLGSAVFLAFPGKFGWLESVILAEAVGLSLSFALVGIWFNYRRLTQFNLKKTLMTCVMTLLWAALGTSAGILISGRPLLDTLVQAAPRLAQAVLLVAGGMVLLLGMVALYRNRQYDALTLQLQRDAERDRLARQLSESQLRLLRSQIEPHFLFNTLGAVQQLAELGAPRAAELTASLIAFLRASMEEMRSEQVSLAEEFRLVEAYLQVMQARLGSRLRYTLRLPESLCAARVPGMVVLTLVENAIKHGIEPALRGGEVTVTARAAGDGVDIEVLDSGAGLAPVPGQGFGLQNVRERLQLAYHGGGSVALRDAPQGGTLAALHLPTLATQAP